jgi:hypothetical protein
MPYSMTKESLQTALVRTASLRAAVCGVGFLAHGTGYKLQNQTRLAAQATPKVQHITSGFSDLPSIIQK